jgi:hypothetical protein
VRAIGILLLAVVVAGCAAELNVSGSKWTKSGTGSNQVTLDETECARGALDAGQTPDLIVGGLLDLGRDIVRERGREGAYEKCMKDRGYQIARR